MPKQESWRVRVMRAVESFVEVEAATPAAAEAAAKNLPGVISVFGRSAISARRPIDPDMPISIEEV